MELPAEPAAEGRLKPCNQQIFLVRIYAKRDLKFMLVEGQANWFLIKHHQI